MAEDAVLVALLDDLGEPLDPDKYDWSLAAAHPLSEVETFQLTYAAQVEWATEGTFGSLNITRDPVVRRFLRIWLRQEVVHAQLFARLLAEHGATVEPLHRTPRQRFAAWRGQMVNRLARVVVGTDFFGLHMTWGAVNELTTLRFYGIIRDRTQHPLLRVILADVMAQEAAHFSFYKRAATARLAGNRRGQKIVRFAMRRLWSIVGSGLRSAEDADRLFVSVIADNQSALDPMDAAIARIPGMEGMHLLRDHYESARDRVAV